MVSYYAMTKIKRIDDYDPSSGKIVFWTNSTAIVLTGLSLGIAGAIHVNIERVLGMG